MYMMSEPDENVSPSVNAKEVSSDANPAISKAMAVRLGEVFNIAYKVFL